MSKPFNEFNQRIEQKGVFDVKSIYSKLIDWFIDNKYEYTEKDSTTKIKSYGTEVNLRFTAVKLIDDFAKSEIKIDIKTVTSDKVSVKGKKLDKGSLEIRMIANLILDYKHRYSSKFGLFLLNIYIRYLIKDRFENYYEDQVSKNAKAIYDLLKEELNLAY